MHEDRAWSERFIHPLTLAQQSLGKGLSGRDAVGIVSVSIDGHSSELVRLCRKGVQLAEEGENADEVFDLLRAKSLPLNEASFVVTQQAQSRIARAIKQSFRVESALAVKLLEDAQLDALPMEVRKDSLITMCRCLDAFAKRARKGKTDGWQTVLAPTNASWTELFLSDVVHTALERQNGAGAHVRRQSDDADFTRQRLQEVVIRTIHAGYDLSDLPKSFTAFWYELGLKPYFYKWRDSSFEEDHRRLGYLLKDFRRQLASGDVPWSASAACASRVGDLEGASRLLLSALRTECEVGKRTSELPSVRPLVSEFRTLLDSFAKIRGLIPKGDYGQRGRADLSLRNLRAILGNFVAAERTERIARRLSPGMARKVIGVLEIGEQVGWPFSYSYIRDFALPKVKELLTRWWR